MADYAGAWQGERGRCHRFVYADGDGHPANCPEPVAATGWKYDYLGHWHVVDACAEHASQIERRPHPDRPSVLAATVASCRRSRRRQMTTLNSLNATPSRSTGGGAGRAGVNWSE
jgi:hypothetical protein